jgi:hypothetical protein
VLDEATWALGEEPFRLSGNTISWNTMPMTPHDLASAFAGRHEFVACDWTDDHITINLIGLVDPSHIAQEVSECAHHAHPHHQQPRRSFPLGWK